MAARYRTPQELVDGLQDRAPEARPLMWQLFREPFGRLLAELVSRHGLDRELLTVHALHSAETLLRSRPAGAFAGLSWSAFRGAVLLEMARIAAPAPAQPANGAPAGPSPLPPSPDYHSETFFRPYDRLGGGSFGGDWYAGRVLPDGSLWVFLADVTGHGYYAYLLACGLPGVWERCWAAHPGAAPEPAELLAVMHDVLADCLPEGIFLECTLVRLGNDGRATVAPAGGTRLVLRAAAGRPRVVKLRGAWLGLRAPSTEEQHVLVLGRGDELLLATDGVFDQLDEQGGAEAVVRSLPQEGALFDVVRGLLEQSLACGPQKDDITLVLLRRRPAAGRGAGDVPV
jgi:hypothetical protein